MEKSNRHSRKRDAILNVMQSSKEHPGAEWIYLKLKQEFSDLSLGTVYRNIAQFLKNGEIMRVTTVNGQERYDADTSCHAHFICMQCGCIQDVDVTVDCSLARIAEEAIGAQVNGVRLSFEGLCAKCVNCRE